jgi:CheY-like chemotaxis protein
MSMRILMFEDEPSILRPVCTFLRAQGYEVYGFASPKDCPVVGDSRCTCARSRACADVLITDMNMPGMSGYELIRRMADKCYGIPTQNMIVISSTMSPGQREECRAIGCHFLPKPFQLGDLLRVVRSCRTNVLPGRELMPADHLGAYVSTPCAVAV